MALDEQDVDTFIGRFARLLGRSRKVAPEYKHRLRRMMALDSLLRFKKLQEGGLTLNDYHSYLMATLADPSLPTEERQRIKDVAIEVFFPDDEPVFREDPQMEKLLAKMLAGGTDGEPDLERLFQLYMNGSLEKAMEYLRRMIQREGVGYPVRRWWGRWGPDRLVKLSLFNSLFADSRSPAAADLAKKLLRSLNDVAGRMHRRRPIRYGFDEGEIRRPFYPGDDIDSIDFDETMESIAGSGRQLEQLTSDDLVAKDQVREETTVIFLHDLSISMHEYLVELMPCFVTAYYTFRRAKKGFAVFTGNAYPIKSVAEDLEDERVVDHYYQLVRLSLQRRLQRGSMGLASFRWAESELENIPSGRKIVFLYSDCDFNEYGSPLDLIRRMADRDAEIVLVHPHAEEQVYGRYGLADLRLFERAGCRLLSSASYEKYIAALEEML